MNRIPICPACNYPEGMTLTHYDENEIEWSCPACDYKDAVPFSIAEGQTFDAPFPCPVCLRKKTTSIPKYLATYTNVPQGLDNFIISVYGCPECSSMFSTERTVQQFYFREQQKTPVAGIEMESLDERYEKKQKQAEKMETVRAGRGKLKAQEVENA